MPPDETPASTPASLPSDHPGELTTMPPTEVVVEGRSRTHGFLVDASIGALFPTSEYEVGFLGSLQVGYRLPWLRQRLGIGMGLSYGKTGLTVAGTDPRITEDGGAWSSDVSTHQLIIDFTVFWRFFDDTRRLVPYAGMGPAIFMHRDRPSTFGAESEEDSTQAGFVMKGGADYRIGPGAAFAELRLNYAPVDRTVTGDHNLGSFGLAFGYRFFF